MLNAYYHKYIILGEKRYEYSFQYLIINSRRTEKKNIVE